MQEGVILEVVEGMVQTVDPASFNWQLQILKQIRVREKKKKIKDFFFNISFPSWMIPKHLWNTLLKKTESTFNWII